MEGSFPQPELVSLANTYSQVTNILCKPQGHICQLFDGLWHGTVKMHSSIYRPGDSECIYSEEQRQFMEKCCQTKEF